MTGEDEISYEVVRFVKCGVGKTDDVTCRLVRHVRTQVSIHVMDFEKKDSALTQRN